MKSYHIPDYSVPQLVTHTYKLPPDDRLLPGQTIQIFGANDQGDQHVSLLENHKEGYECNGTASNPQRGKGRAQHRTE